MKKALGMGGAALLAFALVFSACNDNAYDVTETETIPSLAGPANLKAANDHEGVITLTWDPVYDAQGYEVWRQKSPEGDEEKEPAVKIYDPQTSSGTSGINPLFSNGSNRYDDIISPTNLLKQDVEYTYTVVAISSKSTRGVDVVQSGTSSVTIPKDKVIKIPAAGGYTVTAVTGLLYAVFAFSIIFYFIYPIYPYYVFFPFQYFHPH
jgi:hypothetical protein